MRILICLLAFALCPLAQAQKVNNPRVMVEIPVKGLSGLDTTKLKAELKKKLKSRATIDIAKDGEDILVKTRHKLSVDLSEVIGISNEFAAKQRKQLTWNYRDVEIKGHVVLTLGKLKGFRLSRKKLAEMNQRILDAVGKLPGVKASGTPLKGSFTVHADPAEDCKLGDIDAAIARAVGYEAEEAKTAKPVADVRWIGPEGWDTRKRPWRKRRGSGCSCKRK